ncbi:MAG: polysaccharide deacetylase family protein [Tropicimonas sp.]|uniref:polysaccharide deacetylase family protein n=1 Tax=Tropicimonas sp. TaxID=2067044 RepID=UPI003A8A07A7
MSISPPRPANLAGPAPDYPWPDGKRAALFVAFDVDAESVWLGADAANEHRLVTRSYGGYEARVGVPKLLDLLDRHGVKATFFVTGWTVDAHPDLAREILSRGHEIGHHGYLHLRPDGAPREVLADELDRAFDAMERHLDYRPTGYRAPWGEATVELLEMLGERGITYTSSMRDDIRPYRHVLPSGPGTIEIPVNYAFDDWTYGLNHRSGPRALFGREHVLSIWTEEFDQTRDWGGVTSMVMHPQVTGRPMRINILDQFLTHVRRFDDVWIARGADIAGHFAGCEAQGAVRG